MKFIANTKKTILVISLIFLSLFVFIPVTSVYGADLSDAACQAAEAIGGKCVTEAESNASIGGVIQKITNVLLFLVGAISAIMVIIGGIRFIVSNGDAQATASARNTVLYSIVGVIVAVSAYGIINFTISAIDSNATTPNTTTTPDGNADPTPTIIDTKPAEQPEGDPAFDATPAPQPEAAPATNSTTGTQP